MTIKEFHGFIEFLKNQGQSRFHSPEQIDMSINAASSDKFNEEKERFESTSRIASTMRNFKKRKTITMASGTGDLPDDYDYHTNAYYQGKRVEILTEAEWADRIEDSLVGPDPEYPIVRIGGDVEVLPNYIPNITLLYLSEPAKAKYGYEVVNGNVIHKPADDVELDWPKPAHIDIMLRSLTYLGIALRSEEGLVQFKAYKKQTENV